MSHFITVLGVQYVNPLKVNWTLHKLESDADQPDPPNVVPLGHKANKYVYYCPIDSKFYQAISQIVRIHGIKRTTLNYRFTNTSKGWYRKKLTHRSPDEKRYMKIQRLHFIPDENGKVHGRCKTR